MKQYQILDGIQNPKDLKALSYSELSLLSDEVRDFLITHVSETGGHLASNLGTVELTLALHRVFDCPKDSIVWDVGHQSYTHKMVTGRKERFSTLRKANGLSGFPRPSESVYDAFLAGHSSTSISAAYAISCANRLSHNDAYAVAVIGDGAFTGGMAYEAMNNAGRSRNQLIIVLNHNDMSITKNVGAFARYLSVIRAKPGYLKLKDHVEWLLDHFPFFGKRIKKALRSSKSMLKYLLYHATFFEEMGFAYFGPVDGHNQKALEQVLLRAKELRAPAVIQIETIKGKGYPFAEKDPLNYHGVSPFDVETGNGAVSSSLTFSDVFGSCLLDLGRTDSKICAITAAMSAGTGLNLFAASYEDRFFDVGIAEEHAVTFACGLASKGYLPVFAVYSTFLQRAYDQVLHDAACSGLHILLAVDRAGIVGEDGETHQGIYDVSFLTGIPNVTIFSPSTEEELRLCLKVGLYRCTGVVAVRYPKGRVFRLAGGKTQTNYDLQNGEEDCLVISYGRLFHSVYSAVCGLNRKPSLLKLVQIWPLKEELIALISRYPKVIVFEEAVQSGSISEHLLYALNQAGYRGDYQSVTLPDTFMEQGDVPYLLQKYHLDVDSIQKQLEDLYEKETGCSC